MSWVKAYQMRLRRKRLLIRALRKRRELTPVVKRTSKIRKGDTLVLTTLRNERIRLPYFLQYYRDRGIDHFLIVDNDSSDGSREFLADQPDVSVWHTASQYRRSRFGADWLNGLARRYGHGHWCLTVDPDEFLVYPFCDTRPLKALTDHLDTYRRKSYPALMLDMYPKGPFDAQPYAEGQDPLEIACWFDAGNYMISRNPEYHNLWIQGGPRGRIFFSNDPAKAPSVNKIPLIKWHRSYAYVDSTHMALPRALNHVYDREGGELPSGALLHTKFLHTFKEKAAEELVRKQHYKGSREYRAYHETVGQQPDLWCRFSERYINWRQLEILGLISPGNWA